MFYFLKLLLLVIIGAMALSVAHEMQEEIRHGPPVAAKIGPQTPASLDDRLPTKLYGGDYPNCSILTTTAGRC